MGYPSPPHSMAKISIQNIFLLGSCWGSQVNQTETKMFVQFFSTQDEHRALQLKTFATQNNCNSKLLQLKTFAAQNIFNPKLLQLKAFETQAFCNSKLFQLKKTTPNCCKSKLLQCKTMSRPKEWKKCRDHKKHQKYTLSRSY